MILQQFAMAFFQNFSVKILLIHESEVIQVSTYNPKSWGFFDSVYVASKIVAYEPNHSLF